MLHQLTILGIPGFQRTAGPKWATEADLKERWKLREEETTEPALIEASIYGGDLESAAQARLEEVLREAAGDTLALAEILRQSVFAGLTVFGTEMLRQLGAQVGLETDFGRLGISMGHLLDLWRYDRILGSAQSQSLGELLRSMMERGLWLLETLQGCGSCGDPALIQGVRGLHDTLLHAGPKLGIDPVPCYEAMERKSLDDRTPPAVRGAALGFLWALRGDVQDPSAIRAAALPATLGDFLCGLFALAREHVASNEAIMRTLDELITGMEREEFLVAVPALRLAFQYFPPRELDAVARLVLRLRNVDERQVHSLRARVRVSPDDIREGGDLQARATQMMQRFGLLP